jgi:hypothetical protein
MKHDAKANNEFIKKNHKETITFMKEPYYFPSGHATSHRAMIGTTPFGSTQKAQYANHGLFS